MNASTPATNAPGSGRSSPGARPSGSSAGGGGSGTRSTGRLFQAPRGTVSLTSVRDSKRTAVASESENGGRTVAPTQPERATTSAAGGFTPSAWATPRPTSTGHA